MQYTALGFKKPEYTDYVDIEDLNFNAELFDEMITEINEEVGNASALLDILNGEVI